MRRLASQPVSRRFWGHPATAVQTFACVLMGAFRCIEVPRSRNLQTSAFSDVRVRDAANERSHTCTLTPTLNINKSLILTRSPSKDALRLTP